MKIINLLILIIILSTAVSATTFDSYYLEAEVEKNNVLFSLDATAFLNNENLELLLPPDVQDLQVFVDYKEVLCTLENDVGETIVLCPKFKGNQIITVTYTSSYPLVNLKGQKFFQLDQKISAETLVFTLKLPEGAVVGDERFLTPEPTRFYSDGRRIILSWKESNFDDTFKISMIMQGVEENKVGYGIYLLIFGTLVLAGLYLYKSNKNKKPELMPDVSLPQALLENERKVIKALKEAKDNQLWQKELQIKTELSKVKLSRLLKSLQKRGLVVKEPYGASNIIKLVRNEEKEE